MQGCEGGLAARTRESSGGPAPSPEDVEADVALEVNVGVIDHRFTLHLGGVVRVTLAHLAPGRERGSGQVPQQCLAAASAVASSTQGATPACLPGTHLKTEHKLPALVKALCRGRKR